MHFVLDSIWLEYFIVPFWRIIFRFVLLLRIFIGITNIKICEILIYRLVLLDLVFYNLLLITLYWYIWNIFTYTINILFILFNEVLKFLKALFLLSSVNFTWTFLYFRTRQLWGYLSLWKIRLLVYFLLALCFTLLFIRNSSLLYFRLYRSLNF